MPLRVGINALYLIPGGVGGTEIYLRGLLGALAEIDTVNEYVVFTNRETGGELAPLRLNFRTAIQPVRASFRPARILWEQTGLPLAAARARLDVLFNPGFTAPVIAACPSVTVFHDLQHKRHPEHFRWFDLPFWRILLYAAAHRSRLLLADSEATRADLLRYYRLRADKIRVAPLGVDAVFFDIGRQRRGRRPQPYLLCASTLHPHKNLEALLGAYAELRRRRPEFRLVVTGLRGFHTRAVERQIAALALGDSVRLTGWIPRAELYDLFRDAAGFVYPSSFEGFGLPVLEALAAGIPTACSSIEPLASLAGEAALQFDPGDQAALLDAMLRLVSDDPLRARLSAAGPRQASRYSWRKCAEATLEAIREAAQPDG
ncbi:MAG: glycosyltransferase family 1 protein [Acidobacteriota bacterium]